MNILKQVRFAIPFVLFIGIVVILWNGLKLHPNEVPSPFINKPAPPFSLPTLYYPEKLTNNRDFVGHITLLNVWASWCYACAEEHEYLVELAKNEYVTLYGLDYKDDETAAKKWLAKHGNPYKTIAVDRLGKTGIDWGVYGTPETFLIDKNGLIRFKLVGPVTQEIWQQQFEPLIQKIRKE